MFVTPLKFDQVLDRFYYQYQYDLMLLFVSSFDDNDKSILREIVDNAWRIDRITGNRICFFYFINNSYDKMNENLTRWVKNLSDWHPLYGEGVSVTMQTADDICNHFGLLRSSLPAFILISRDKKIKPQVFTIHNYNDLEDFLTPLNILHSFLEDNNAIISQYNSERRRNVILQQDVDRRNEKRKSWNIALQRLERKKAKELQLGMDEKANERDRDIQYFKVKLEENPTLVVQGEDESVLFPNEELHFIREKSIERLDISLNSHHGESLITLIQDTKNYYSAILQIWDLVRTRKARISRVIEKIRNEINERGFDIFISCKSQDYALAYDLYKFLDSNGFRPFLADKSIKEIGIDQYTALIGEVINVCDNMIVFATRIDYIETPYVAAEWHTFVNDINTGHKPNAKIVNILSSEINIHSIPAWLRDKQCFTTENYKDNLLYFLNLKNNKNRFLQSKQVKQNEGSFNYESNRESKNVVIDNSQEQDSEVHKTFFQRLKSIFKK